jgi:hypothetical protein
MTRSTLEGWTPAVGQLVWQQLYNVGNAMSGPADLASAVEQGNTYGPRYLCRVLGVTVDHPNAGVTQIHTKDDGCGPGLFPSKGHGPSWADTSWGVWTDAAEEGGELF